MANEIGINRITPSGLMMYEKCPKAFYYAVWLGIKLPQPMVHLFFGTAIHLAIDEVYRQMKENIVDFNMVAEKFTSNFKLEHIDDTKYSQEEKETKFLEMKEDGLEILDQFWSKRFELAAKGVLPTEFEIIFKGTLHNPETKEPWPLPMSMRIDGENEERITEFKTSSTPYDPIETRKSLQSLSYVFTRYVQTGKIKPIDYVVMIKKRKKDKIQHISIQYEPADMLHFDEKVRSIIKKIELRQFDKPLKDHPYFCDCRRYEQLLEN